MTDTFNKAVGLDTPIDIIVPTHNKIEKSIRCVEAIYKYTKTPFHLIIVDDSTDLTPIYFRQFAKEHDNVTFLHQEEPFKCGNEFFNLGIRNSKCKYIATIMNSVTVEPDWLPVSLELMENDPKIGIIGYKCLQRNGLIESAGIGLSTEKFKIGLNPTYDIGRDEPSHRYSAVGEVQAVQWAFALLRKEAVEGNLSEELFYGFVGWDDLDNSMVVKSKGWKVIYCGLGCGYHETRATREKNSIEAFKQNLANAETFYKRWGMWDEYKKCTNYIGSAD